MEHITPEGWAAVFVTFLHMDQANEQLTGTDFWDESNYRFVFADETNFLSDMFPGLSNEEWETVFEIMNDAIDALQENGATPTEMSELLRDILSFAFSQTGHPELADFLADFSPTSGGNNDHSFFDFSNLTDSHIVGYEYHENLVSWTVESNGVVLNSGSTLFIYETPIYDTSLDYDIATLGYIDA